jgi:hypothetical protein
MNPRLRTVRLRPEALEDRAVPATFVAIGGVNKLVQFNSNTPGIFSHSIAVTGLQANETIRGIDIRPATSRLYALGDSGRLYTVNQDTGAATLVAALAADPMDLTSPFVGLSGTEIGMDFDPVADRIRVVTNTGQNVRINPTNGLVTTDANLNPGSPAVVASAYANNLPGASTTTLYDLDSTADVVVIQNPANSGTLTQVGNGLGVNFGPNVSFDIQTRAGIDTGYATAAVNGITGLYTINLTNGRATLVGTVGASGAALRGLAVIPEGFSATEADSVVTFIGSRADDTLTIDSTPGGLLHHNRFTAGDPGFNSDIDFDSTVAGDQTISVADPKATFLIDPGPGADTVNVIVSKVVAIVDVTQGTDHVTGADGLVIKTTLTYPDVDGDAVALEVSRGTLSLGNFTFEPSEALPGAPSGAGLQLTRVQLGSAFARTNVTVNAHQAGRGDGFVNVGAIDATGVDLGTVQVAGDLGRLVAGDLNQTETTGVAGLTVQSVGDFGLATQGGSGDLKTIVTGRLGYLRVTGDIREALVGASSAGSVTVGGSLIGGIDGTTGHIQTAMNMGAARIGGDIVGGLLEARGTLASVSIGGSLVGGTAYHTGTVNAGLRMGPVFIGGSVIGNSPAVTGIISTYHMGPVRIVRNLTGTPGSGVRISVEGPADTADGLEIASVSVGGRVEDAAILGGYTEAGAAGNASVRIGPVTVGGNWIASSLVAGVDAGVDASFGTADDASINVFIPTFHSQIVSVTIKGQAFGTFGGADHFGFVAQEVGAFKVGGRTLQLTPGTGNDVFNIGITGDLTVREVV